MKTLTVYQHLYIFSLVKGLADVQQVIDETLELFNLEKYREYRIEQLSGGNKKKVSIALAYLGKPKLILLDEPSSSLDPFSKQEIFQILLKIQKEHQTTLIITSHNFDEAEFFSKNIILLSKGAILAQGNLVDIKRYFESGFELKLVPKQGYTLEPELIPKLEEALSGVLDKEIVLNLHDVSIFVPLSHKEDIKAIYGLVHDRFSADFTLQISTNLLENAIRHRNIRKVFDKSLILPSEGERIIEAMEQPHQASSSSRVLTLMIMRWKLTFLNYIQLTTLLLVVLFLLIFIIYIFYIFEKNYFDITLNTFFFLYALLFLFTEGYNNFSYSYLLVYEKTQSIKKILFCNGVSVREYYFSRLASDLLFNVVVYLPLLAVAAFMINWRIESALLE